MDHSTAEHTGSLNIETNAAPAWPSKRMPKAFWWMFFIGLFFCAPAYDSYFPDGTFDHRRHARLASHERCNDNEECADVVDRWRNIKTGQVFTRNERDVHMSIILFAYGLVGCFAFGYFRRHMACAELRGLQAAALTARSCAARCCRVVRMDASPA